MATLQEVIQQMIDDGKSEADITAFVQQVKAKQKPYVAKPPVEGGPEDYWSGFLHSLKPGGTSDQAALAGAKGFAKGIIPGVGEGVKGTLLLPVALLKAVINTVGGAGNLIDDPQGTLASAWESVKGIPGQARDAVKAAMDVAAKDPEGFGKEVGKYTGIAETGVASAKLVPMLPKPIAEKVGTAAETFGKRASWPLRISGAHQIIGGNVLGGIGTMMAPEMIGSTGKAMRTWGEPPPLNESGARTYDMPATKTPAAPIRVQARPAPTVVSERVPIIGGAAEESPRVQKVMAKEQAVKIKANEAVDAAQLKKLKEFQDAKAAEAKAQETATKDIETNLGKSLDSMGNPAAEGLKDVDAAIADEAKQGAQRRAASAQREAELKAQATIDKAKAGLVKGEPKITETVKAPGSTMTTTYAPEAAAPGAGTQSIEYQSLRQKYGQVAADNWLKQQAPPAAAPAEPVGSIEAVGEGLPTAPPEEAPVAPASRSRRAQSAASGISVNDMEALKQILADNPDLSAEEAAQELVKQRAQRSQMYRSDARLSKLEQQALERDTSGE